jgi:subtilisin family serine protease
LVPSSQSGLSLRQLEQMNATAVHDSGYIGTGVLIALLDEGFNFHDKHQALRNQIVPPGFSRDFVDGDTVVTDTTRLTMFEHGTWTLGLLAGYLPGIYLGSAYGATVALARTERDGSETPSEMLYWSQGAEWADSLGADVISSSVGYNSFDSPFPSLKPSDLDGHTSEITRAAEIAASKGILVVNAVGNGGSAAPLRLVAPADVNGDSLIAAGAVDSFGNVPSFSSRGPTADGRIKPDLAARGVHAWLIAATGPPDVYTQGDGSSFAAPLIAGLAACLLEARPSWTPTEVIRSLRETASNICAPDNSQGWGIPDGLAALRWAPGPVAPALPAHGYLELELQGPNPVRPARGPMRVRFGLGPRLSSTSKARLQVFDATGRLVRDLYRGSLCCGHWRLADWDGIDHDGREARPGLYFVNFDVEGRVSTLRVALLR